MLCGFAIRITLLASFFFFCSGVGDYKSPGFNRSNLFYDGFQIRRDANKAEDIQGCILVGENRVKGMVVNSRIWLHRLMKKMKEAQLKEESIWITII